MKYTYTFIIYLLVVSFLSQGCEKEEEKNDNNVSIKTKISGQLHIRENEPVFIDYEISGTQIDSISLALNHEIHQTHYIPQDGFHTSISESGYYQAELVVFHHSGLTTKSDEFTINCYGYNTPNLRYEITNANGQNHYFVGEQLLIRPYSWTEGFELEECSEVSCYFNGQLLGTLTQGPYIFESQVITKPNNEIEIKFIDKDQIPANVIDQLDVPFDENPEVEINLPNQAENNFFSDHDVRIGYSIHDNTYIDYLEVYFNNELKQTIDIDKEYDFGTFVLDTLAIGKYSFHLIAYDDRGYSTSSNTINFSLHPNIDLNFHDNIYEFETTNNPNLVYGLAKSKLIMINPIDASISEIDFIDEVSNCMDYDSENNLLYIGFTNGKIRSYQFENQQMDVITDSYFTNIQDLVKDPNSDNIYLIDGSKLKSYNLVTENITSSDIELSENPCLAYHDYANCLIAGGENSSSGNKFYKMQFENNEWLQMDWERFGGYVAEIITNPINNQILLRGNRQSGYIFDIENFGDALHVIEASYPESIAFNHDFSQIVIGVDTDNYLEFYNADNYEKTNQARLAFHTYEIPDPICNTSDGNIWLISSYNGMQNESKLRLVHMEWLAK
jgi:hypothetical protein